MSLLYLGVVYTLVVCGALGQDSSTKTYTGYRLDPLSVRKIYHYDLVIAIIEVSEDNTLLNCELVDIENDEEREETLKNMTSIDEPKLLTLDEMITLISQCDQLDPQRVIPEEAWHASQGVNVNYTGQNYSTAQTNTSGLTILKILSGTKWCGSGDIATTYFDLGPNIKLDMCCRTHDMCPSKILSNSTRYNLTNDSEYTRSHCSCDKIFHTCLKMAKDTVGDVMGGIYFNLIDMKCLDERNGKIVFELPPPY